mmetsp:Transcript_14802/g.2471  ORF Transcript_14802/g.2471 Transcript_14802/m.2471 type:complete len:94 (+) Transcript_14802:298-579(+)
MMIYIVANIINSLQINYLEDEFMYVIVLEMMYITVILNHSSGLIFGYILTGSVFSIIIWLCVALHDSRSLNLRIEATFFIIIYILINAAASFL